MGPRSVPGQEPGDPVANLVDMRSLGFSLAIAALAPVSATATPIEDVNIGVVVTIAAPETYRPSDAITVSGHLRFQVGLPIVFETAQPLPGQTVTLMLDEEPLRTVTTNADGSWQTEVQFPATPPHTHELRAVAFDGTPLLQTSSRTVFVRRELIFSELRIDPPTAGIVVNGGVQLAAIALDGDGREHDVAHEATWSSSEPDVVSVSNDDGSRGLVTGVSSGSATISAQFETFTATATISVE